MRLLLFLFLIYGCGRGLNQFGSNDNISVGHPLEGDSKRSEQLAEVRESTDVGNGNEAEIDGNGGEPPVVEPVMVTASFLTGCWEAEGNSIQCALSSDLAGSTVIFDGVKIYDQGNQEIPPASLQFSHENGVVTIEVATEFSIGSMTVNEESVTITPSVASAAAAPQGQGEGDQEVSGPTPVEVPPELLLRDIPGGLEDGDFDVDAYSCEGKEIEKDADKDKDKSKDKDKDKGKGDKCLLKSVNKYDDEVNKNGVDLLNPADSPEEIAFSQTGVDFCVIVLNASLSKEAIVKINELTFRAVDLNAEWAPGCTSFRLDEGSPNKLNTLQISFPSNVMLIPGGLAQAEPKDVEESLDRAGSLTIRFVNASDGTFLKEVSLYNH
ncbi:MAG: hypothetical protein HRU09_09670 [Oligoflexales bacterium]|nr:hypothetical protein [Oligoflexales bacterium]